MNKVYKIIGKKGRITIPYNFREKLNIRAGDVVSFEMKNDSVIVRKEALCGGCISDNAPKTKPTNETTLLEFIDELTPDEQHAAFIHLAVLRAQKEKRVNA